jgi:hydrogenase maturation factor
MTALTLDGPQMFLRYAFRPNLLGYCGGEDSRALFQYGVEGRGDRGLIELESQFEGAYPYLQLIARANRIDDPFDLRVVEAYWIGNPLLERVDLGALYRSVEERFKGRTRPTDWRWLAGKPPAGARPHHSFHVFDVFPRAGLMRSGSTDHLLETMEQCRIRWGRVASVDGSDLVVETQPLALEGGKLELALAHTERVLRLIDGQGFVDKVAPGDWVSLHWGWVCDVLSEEQRAQLERYTRHHLRICNETL